jgi:hypothetical protein
MPDNMNSLNSLKGWPDNNGPYETHLVETVERACMKPLRDISLSELQALLQCGVAPDITIPLALEALAENPFVYARHDDGDLFKTVLRFDARYWEQNPNDFLVVSKRLADFEATVDEINEAARAFRAATTGSKS